MKILIILISIALTNSGCFTYQLNDDVKAITLKNNKLALNGTYQNYDTATSNQQLDFWQTLNKKTKDNFKVGIPNNNEFVKLEVLSKTQIKASLLFQDSVIKTTLLKGKFEGNFFSVKKRRKGIVIPFLYVRTRGYKILLAKNNHNQIIINAFDHQFGWILLLHAGHTKPYDMLYNSKSD
jgi:hypothetical protein